MDKRAFHTLLNDLKDKNPDQFELLENIQEAFDKTVTPITDSEIRALRTFPIQFIPRIELEDGEWTTKLHIWAENGVAELVEIDVYGQTVIDYLIDFAYGSGKYEGQEPDILLQQILVDFSNGLDTPAEPESVNSVDFLKAME